MGGIHSEMDSINWSKLTREEAMERFRRHANTMAKNSTHSGAVAMLRQLDGGQLNQQELYDVRMMDCFLRNCHIYQEKSRGETVRKFYEWVRDQTA